MKPVRYAGTARRDVEAIELHYRQIHPDLALVIVGRVVAAARFLGETPRAGPAMPRGEHRKWRVRRTPYLLFYRVEPEGIRILRVIHAARREAGE